MREVRTPDTDIDYTLVFLSLSLPLHFACKVSSSPLFSCFVLLDLEILLERFRGFVEQGMVSRADPLNNVDKADLSSQTVALLDALYNFEHMKVSICTFPLQLDL